MRDVIKKFGLVSVLALSACGGNSSGGDLKKPLKTKLEYTCASQTAEIPITFDAGQTVKEFLTGINYVPWGSDKCEFFIDPESTTAESNEKNNSFAVTLNAVKPQ